MITIRHVAILILIVADVFPISLLANVAVIPWWNDATPTDQPPKSTTTTMPLRGGRSPDGKIILQVIGNDSIDEGYAFGLFKSDETSLISQVSFDSGFCVLQGASEIDRALWNSESTMVAIEDHDTRHSMALHLVELQDGKAIKIQMPAFGRAMAIKTADIHGGAEGACGCDPLSWIGSVLTFRFYAGPYVSDVKVKVSRSNPPRATLVSESPPLALAN
jgi:hypothetical protein